MSSDVSIEDIQAYIRGKANMSMLHVRDSDDPDYKTMRDFVTDINPDTEDYMSCVASEMSKLMSSLRHMEFNDYNRIVNTFRKYEVKGESNGIRGVKTYGFDKSRVDNRLIRRKRGN